MRGGKFVEFDGVDSWKQKSLFPFWNLPKNKDLEPNAKKLRKAGILSEVLFWQAFKNKKLSGFDIDRQVIIGNYIVDFFIPELGLVVEIDGESHDFKGEYDQLRENYLKNLGLEIIHYKDIEIKKSMDFVSNSFLGSVEKRIKWLQKSTPSNPTDLPPLKEGNFNPNIFAVRVGEVKRRVDVDGFLAISQTGDSWVNLGDICEIKRGKFTFRPRNAPHLYGGNYPFIQTGDVAKQNNTNSKIGYSQTLNEEGLKVIPKPIPKLTNPTKSY